MTKKNFPLKKKKCNTENRFDRTKPYDSDRNVPVNV